MTIDKAILTELTDRLAEVIGAVATFNGHTVSIAQFYACQRTIMETGKTPAGC